MRTKSLEHIAAVNMMKDMQMDMAISDGDWHIKDLLNLWLYEQLSRIADCPVCEGEFE